MAESGRLVVKWLMKTQPHENESKGIWIPRAIWIARGLSLREKALLAELGTQESTNNYQPSNQYLIELLDIGERQVRACLAALRHKGFITIRLNADHERVIRVTGKHTRPSKRSISAQAGKRSALRAATQRE